MCKDEQSILKKQTALLYQQALFSNATVIVAAILMYSLFAEHAFSSMLLAWSVAISLLAGLRLLLLYTYKRVSRHGEIKPEKWLWAYTMLTFLVGLIWAGSSIFYVLIDDIQISTLFYVLISTVVAAAVPVLSAWFPAFLAYTVPQVIMLTSMSFYQIQTTPVINLPIPVRGVRNEEERGSERA